MVAETDSPKPPPERLSFTLPVINSADRVWLVLAGADKAGALGLALAGASIGDLPAAGVEGRKRTVFFVDKEAAAEVPETLIAPSYYWTSAHLYAVPARRARSCSSASPSSCSASASVRRSFTYARWVL
jgi:6-phosphogluconolactonase